MRQVAHLFFDKLWQEWPMTRAEAYELMRERMEMEEDLHIGHLDAAQCEVLIERVQERISYLRAQATGSKFEEVDHQKVDLDGPFECSSCGGHLMVDVTFLDQVSWKITCPYCNKVGKVV